MTAAFEPPKQILSKESYYEQRWFDQEKAALFDQSWVFAGIESDLTKPGDYICLNFMNHPLFVIRTESGELKAFHNLCRHRGCEVLENSGNTGAAIVCPYHRWTYQLDGTLRGIPNESECFDQVDRDDLALHCASVDTYRGLIFVNPSASPGEDFTTFIAGLDGYAWPHKFDDNSMEFAGTISYEMQCNWKIFYENAIDGYHLAYLHDKTLGKLYPSDNLWIPAGRNHLWFSTERDDEPQSNSVLSAQIADGYGTPRFRGQESSAPYPGVVMLFPLTILSPSPWGFYISILEPVAPETTIMRTLAWVPPGSGGRFDIDNTASEAIRLKDLDTHPLDSGNFQIEDMWIVEKIQRNLHSPHYNVGPLADGDGAEGPLMHFQQSVVECLQAAEADEKSE